MSDSHNLFRFIAGENLRIGDLIKIDDDGRAVKRRINLEVRQYLPIIVVSSAAAEGDEVTAAIVEAEHGS